MKKLKKTILQEVGDEVFNNPRQGGLLIRGIFVLIARERGFATPDIAAELKCSMASVVNAETLVRNLLDAGDPAVKAAVAKVRAALSRQDGVTRTVTASCEIHNGRMFSTINLLMCLTDMQRLVAVLAAWHLRGGIALGGGEAVACFPMPPDDPAIEAVAAKINELGQSGGETMLNAFRSLYPDVYRVG